ncbi:MAG: hypothetical protein R3F39_09190 [Myxococcota bacterium]
MRVRACVFVAAIAALALGCVSGCGESTTSPAGPDVPDDAGPDASTADLTTPDAPAPLDPIPPVYAARDRHPEPPAILRDVALIDDDAKFTRPYVPGHRTTMDGRVAIRVQGGPPGTEVITTSLSFFLFTPEALSQPIMPGPAGAQILAQTDPFNVLFPPALDPAVTVLGHHAICDPTEPFPVAGERPNPYACGPADAHDCYDLTIISTTAVTLTSQLWGTPVTVEVASPKTAQARIIRAELGEPVAGALIPANNEWTEPAVTQDGRLLTGRWGRAPREWTNPETGVTLLRPYDLAYSVLPDGAAPCDITGWTRFHPMSHAPYDPQMVGRYGLANYPFRDSEGQPIPDGEDLGGTYPWVDREGDNVFMAGIPGRIVEQSHTAYPRRCVTPGCESYLENTDWDRGFLVAGAWTHGKFVLLDAMINNQDWAVGVTPAAHWMVDLYKDTDGQAVPVRFGAGRYIDAIRTIGGPYPPGYSHNANILDSLQNVLNHTHAARPVTPRDVVWLMSTGVATDEVAFDDFVDPNAFIVSHMQASVTQIYTDDGESLAFPRYWNGQLRELTIPLPLPEVYVLRPGVEAEVHVQNAATSLDWKVPAYGLVEPGLARIEPVALGGIKGKGYWSSGEAPVRYAVPSQERPISGVAWTIGLFVDSRGGDSENRALMTFPDGSAVHLVGRSRLRYRVAEVPVHEVILPEALIGDSGWVHLGWRVRPGHRDVTLLVNGYALDRFQSPEPLFQMSEGEFVLAGPAAGVPDFQGVRGWLDELVVLAHDVNPEVACNHAHGTMVRVDDSATWAATAAAYPAWAHAEVAATAAGAPGARYACFHDYRSDYAAHLDNIPAGTTGMRERINFPEGPLRAGAPRPDSSGNSFCLSCHSDSGKGGLTLAALKRQPEIPAEEDRRRQPTQPPRRVFGNIPAGWLPPGAGPGSPLEAQRAPAEGLLVDRWLLPAAE